MQTPRYEHDCTACTYLGRYKRSDLYRCNDTVIARHSSEGSDYSSLRIRHLVDLAGDYPALAEAFRRSTEATL